MNAFRSALALTVLLSFWMSIGSPRAAAEESWGTLLDLAPTDANALVIIHADKVRRSEFAERSGWNSAERAVGGLRSVLPKDDIQRVVFAARLNLVDLASHWEACVFETKSDPTLTQFMPDVGEPLDDLAAKPAARLPYNAYALKFAPHKFGTLAPADRQKAAQWARFATSSSLLRSAYLTKIAAFPETVGTEIMLGLDLTDAVDTARVRQAMRESSAVRSAEIDADQATDVIASMEGIALGVRVLDQASGMIRIDFTRDPAVLAKTLKSLLLEQLANRGAMIPEFNDWTLKIDGRTAFLGGNLSAASLSLILSIVEPQLFTGENSASSQGGLAAASATATGGGNASTKQTATRAHKSRVHFGQVNEIVGEIRFPKLDMKTTAFGTWIDRQARRIDQLPVLDVDPELLDYSQGVAKSLRVTASKQRGAAIRSSANPRNTGSYGYNFNNRPTETDSRIQGRMESAAANLEHVDIMRMIDDETAAIRRKLTERYRIEF